MAEGRKSLCVALICWTIGGFIGLHHFYLGRDKHAFITFATFGGYFGFGLLRDLWRLPEYVKDANNDADYLDWLCEQMKTHQRPPSSLARHSGMMIVSNSLAHLVIDAVPSELLDDRVLLILRFILVPFAAAFGVWVVGNIGRHEGSIGKPLLAAYVASIPSIFYDIPLGSFSSLASTVVFNRYSKKWRVKSKKSKHVFKRILILIVCILLYLSLWSAWLYFGCTIEDPETSERIKCRIAYNNFINSPAYTNLSEAIWMLVEHARNRGIYGLWAEIMQEFDVSGKSSALSVLDLSEDATPQEILAQYKKLSREYHPDREKDESKKAEKHEKFIQVQEAFRKLESKVQRYKLQREQENNAPKESRDEL